MIVRQGRKGLLKGCAAAAVLAAMALATPAMAKEYIVKFKDQTALRAAATERSIGLLQVTDVHEVGSLVKIAAGDARSADVAKELAALMARDDVEYVVENFQLQTMGVPNDPRYAEQWALPKVRAPEAWDVTPGSRSVVVAVIDTGVDYNHPDLKANIWVNPGEIAGNGRDDDGNGFVDDVHGWDFLGNDNDPNDQTSSQNPGHGTHCAGIVGAVGDNGVGVSGMAQKVAMMPLRFIGPNGQGDLMAAIKSIDYAIANKADIISASWGAQVSASQAQPLVDAVGRANTAGVVFVAAAASDPQDGKPSWSNYGKAKVHLASPGLDIVATLPNNAYGKLSGTSMATPLVAGLVALLKSQADLAGKALDGPALRAILQTTGAKVAIETACMCRVDAKAALDAIETDKLVVVPAAATFAPNDSARFTAVGGSGTGYRFTSGNAAVVEVQADGSMTAKGAGETTVSVTDSRGATAQSLTIRVAEGSGGGTPSDCPLGDPMMCELMCQIMPTLPWCN